MQIFFDETRGFEYRPGHWGVLLRRSREAEGGSSDVSEYRSLEAIADSFADADAITYALEADGFTADAERIVLDSPLWQCLPGVKAGKVFALQYTQAATTPRP